MNFYWKDKKDQLFARRGARRDVANDPWTTFQMELREPTPIPQPFDFTRFLASSITFMRHLLDVSVFLDDKRLSRLTKSPGSPKALSLPKGLRASSPLNTMTVNGLQTTRKSSSRKHVCCAFRSFVSFSSLNQGRSHAVGVHGRVREAAAEAGAAQACLRGR